MNKLVYLANVTFILAVLAAPMGSESGRQAYGAAWIRLKGIWGDIQDDLQRAYQNELDNLHQLVREPEDSGEPETYNDPPPNTPPANHNPPPRNHPPANYNPPPRNHPPANYNPPPRNHPPANNPPPSGGGGAAADLFARAKAAAREGLSNHQAASLRQAISLCDQALAAGPSESMARQIRMVKYACMKSMPAF